MMVEPTPPSPNQTARFARRAAMLVVVLAVLLGALAVRQVQRSGRPFLTGNSERVGTFVTRVVPDGTPYEKWVEAGRATRPTFSGILIQDVRTHPLRPWPELGVDGLYVQMADYQIIDGWILEIPPRGFTKPQRHMFEAGVYFFGGPGHTMIQQEGRSPQRVDWKRGTLFSIPLNVRYQHFNDGDLPARLVAVTSFPYVLNSTDSERFVFNNAFEFRNRYDGEPDFATTRQHVAETRTTTNLVEDALIAPLDPQEYRGEGVSNMHWSMAGNTMVDLHASEMPGQIYKRAHRHSSDAFILILSGRGYSLAWREGQYDKRIRVDWQEGTMFVPPIYWYHQHLNPSAQPARSLAINAALLVSRLGLRFSDQVDSDDDAIEAEFLREVASRGKDRTAP